MSAMLVTLEVSKLSGWLNAVASCRVKRSAHAMRGEVRAGRLEGGGAAVAQLARRAGPY